MTHRIYIWTNPDVFSWNNRCQNSPLCSVKSTRHREGVTCPATKYKHCSQFQLIIWQWAVVKDVSRAVVCFSDILQVSHTSKEHMHFITPTSTTASTCRLWMYVPPGWKLLWSLPTLCCAELGVHFWCVSMPEPRPQIKTAVTKIN